MNRKNPFKRHGFDSIIAPEFQIAGSILFDSGKTIVIDGSMVGESIKEQHPAHKDSTLIIGGSVTVDTVNVTNVTIIDGILTCKLLIVEGMLSVKCGAEVNAEEIRYRNLTIENGSVVHGQMNHLDRISSGEQT